MKQHEDIERVLFTADQLKVRVAELGREITEDYKDAPEPIVLVCILKGSVIFYADLVREIDHDCRMDFLVAKSYVNGTESSQNVRILKDLDDPIEGQHVIIVEDIIDTGLTLSYVRDNLIRRGAKSLKICTLLNKRERRDPKVKVDVDYVGFVTPNEFVAGYGLDYNQKYRTLPDVGVLKREIYEKG